MKTWVETSWIYRTFGQNQKREANSGQWSNGIFDNKEYTPNYDALSEALEAVRIHCNKSQFTIKAMFPLTSAHTHTYGQALEYTNYGVGAVRTTAPAGIGYGWGFSNVIGFAALLEKTELVTEEEYDRRLAEMDSPSLAPDVAPKHQTA